MENYGWKVGFWTAVAVAVVMIAIALITANGYGVALEDLSSLQADYDALSAEKKACGDGWYEQLELTATLISANSECEADKLWYKNAHENNLVHTQLTDLIADYNVLLAKYHAVRWERDQLQRGLVGAPCHSHYDGLHCTWETCTVFVESEE